CQALRIGEALFRPSCCTGGGPPGQLPAGAGALRGPPLRDDGGRARKGSAACLGTESIITPPCSTRIGSGSATCCRSSIRGCWCMKQLLTSYRLDETRVRMFLR